MKEKSLQFSDRYIILRIASSCRVSLSVSYNWPGGGGIPKCELQLFEVFFSPAIGIEHFVSKFRL